MDQGNAARKKWLNIDLLVWVIAILGVLLFQALRGPHPLDDSYITFRYARNISSGLGFVYNPGELVQGTTTPLYTFILALFSIVFGSDRLPAISFGIALIADVINTWLLFRIARKLLNHELAAMILAIVFLLQPLRLNVATGGMETSFFICLLLAMYDSYLVRNKVLTAAVFGSLAILTRVDAVLAVGPVVFHVLWMNRALALKAILLGAGILAPWFIWATWYFGNPIPFSITAKMAAYPNYSPAATLIHILTFLGTGTVGPYENLAIIFPGLVIAIFLVILGVQWIREGNYKSLIVITYPFLYFLVMTVRHAPLFFSWYYLPLMPGVLIIFFGAFLRLFRQISRPEKPSRQEIRFGILGLILIIIPAVLMQIFPGWSQTRQAELLFQQASTSVRDQAADKLVYAPDIGVIGWELEKARILDPIGLVSPISLQYLDGTRGANLIASEMIRNLQPDFVIAREDFIAGLMKDPGFQANYQLFWKNDATYDKDQKVVVYKLE